MIQMTKRWLEVNPGAQYNEDITEHVVTWKKSDQRQRVPLALTPEDRRWLEDLLQGTGMALSAARSLLQFLTGWSPGGANP